ncbi:hypothetical protein TrRE_jg5219, partial [Triparma retinervis]
MSAMDVNKDIREYTGIFEGPEKTLEVCFRTVEGSNPTENQGLVMDWVGYSRKNLLMPEQQVFPQRGWGEEMDYLRRHREGGMREINGNGYTLGPVTGDHWFVWVADRTVREDVVGTDRVINIMMFDIDERVRECFYTEQYKGGGKGGRGNSDGPDRATEGGCDDKKDDDEDAAEGEADIRRISEEMTKKAGIDRLVPGAASCSYASFETNAKLKSYHSLINNVVRTFKPKRFVLTMMADEAGLGQIQDNPLESRYTKPINVPIKDRALIYRRSNLA